MEAQFYDRPEPMREPEHDWQNPKFCQIYSRKLQQTKGNGTESQCSARLYAVKRSAMIGRLTWLQDHLIIIATVQPDMTKEQPLLCRLVMHNSHHL